MKKLRNIHPGEILNKEFLTPWEFRGTGDQKKLAYCKQDCTLLYKAGAVYLPIRLQSFQGILETHPNSGLNYKMILMEKEKCRDKK